jgi:hypothetical protein
MRCMQLYGNFIKLTEEMTSTDCELKEVIDAIRKSKCLTYDICHFLFSLMIEEFNFLFKFLLSLSLLFTGILYSLFVSRCCCLFLFIIMEFSFRFKFLLSLSLIFLLVSFVFFINRCCFLFLFIIVELEFLFSFLLIRRS